MLKKLRIAKGLTQQALSERSGVPLRTIQKYENGECNIENITLKMALKLSKALDVSVEDLIK